MPKELPGKDSGVTADDVVKSDHLTNIPGKTTNVRRDGLVGDPYIDHGDFCSNAPGVEDCILQPDRRARLLGDFQNRVLKASSNCTAGIKAAEVHTLLKKPADMHWALSLLLDVVSDSVIRWATKGLRDLKAGKVKEYSDLSINAIQGGHYDQADRADRLKNIYQGISDETIANRVKIAGGLAKTQARPLLAAALADTRDKQETVSYLGQLQTSMDLAFQEFASNASAHATDVELISLWEGFNVIHHGVEMYERSVLERVERFKKSGIQLIGRTQDPLDEIAGDQKDTRVVWVQHHDGTKTLQFQVDEYVSTDQGPAPEFGGGVGRGRSGSGAEKLAREGRREGRRFNGVVPREFWEEAIAISEEKWGKVETVEDPFAAHLHGAQDYARRMNAAKVSAASAKTNSAPSTKTPNKLFGGQ
jgi:hypothetical protein